MSNFKHLSDLEVQQITFDWRYRGFTVLELLTEDEVDEVNAELEKLRQERIGTTTEDGKEWCWCAGKKKKELVKRGV
jgi:hypothetical protein